MVFLVIFAPRCWSTIDLSLHLQRRVLQEYLRATTDLAHVDSHRRRRNWGAWRHPHTHTWYEIDAFLIVSKSLRLVNPGLHCYPGVADHWAKEISLHLGNPDKRLHPSQRKEFWKHVKFSSHGTPPKFQVQRLRGPSEQAHMSRQPYSPTVEQILEEVGVPPAPTSTQTHMYDGGFEGWTESNNAVCHAYTDGSGVPATIQKAKLSPQPQPLGGVQVFFGSKSYDACGPVVTQPGPQHDGGERCTNNTAEATALLRIIQWGTDNHRLLGTLVIHYDSEYATNVAVGCSRGYLKIGL